MRMPPMEKAFIAATRPPFGSWCKLGTLKAADFPDNAEARKILVLRYPGNPRLCRQITELREFLPNQLPQDVLQDPAVAVVLNFVWCVDSHACLKTSFFSILCAHAYSHEHSRLNTGGYTFDV